MKRFNDVTAAVYSCPLLHKIFSAGGDMTDAVLALVNEREELRDRITRLEAIAPKRLQVDGVTYVYHTPDDLIPITKIK